MLHEKPDKSFYWKDKLDGLDHLPGQAKLDKTLAWEKLHNRLGERPRKKIAHWYWAAAACVLLLMGVQWFVMSEKDNGAAKNNWQPIRDSSSITMVPFRDSVNIPSRLQVERNHTIYTKSSNKKQNFPSNKTTGLDKDIHELSKKELRNTIIPELHNISINPDTIGFVAATPVKRKLRIVHINELDKPVEEKMQYARNYASPVFRINPLNQDAFPGFTSGINASDNIIKIKLPPSN